jgi:thiol-disulfide isomerase/thioredoxin
MCKKTLYIALALCLAACDSGKKEVEHYISVAGCISDAQGKYLKIIDMTKSGFQPDSIAIGDSGKFAFRQQSAEPKDFVLYIEPENNIRILPCPDEEVVLTATYPNVAETFTVAGSPESERLAVLLRKHRQANAMLDTLNHYYMAHQLDRNIAQIVADVRAKSDSVYRADRQFHEQFIAEKPGSLASYVALSSKLGLRTNLFNIQDDFKYFEMVDTALQNRYDTIAITMMLNRYVSQERAMQAMRPKRGGQISVGDTMPDIALSNPYGDTIRVSNLKAKYLLVNFWGSWCRPCRESHAELRRVFRTYRYRGFDIYSVALERSLDDWKNTIREDRLIWVNHVSELNYMDSKVARQLGIDAVPFNLLIDENRVVLAKNLTPAQLDAKLAELIK